MRAILALLVLMACGGVRAAEPAILNAATIPNIDASGRAQYARFLLMNLPRAFALSANGKTGWFGGAGTLEDVRAKAVASCTEKGGTGCAVYAENLRVVWPGRETPEPPAPPGPLIQTGDYAFVPDPRFIWRGPQTAVGLYVWGHGQFNGVDSRGQQPQAYVRAFNNAGFDVVRFDRDPFHDYRDDAADWLRQGLATLRQQGWKKIVAGGQSRGAWTSLQMLETAGLADAVVAVSPAYFSGGTDNTGDMYRLTQSVRSPATRVAIMQFTGDIYLKDMDSRVGMYRDGLPSRVAALLTIDRPAGITGHGGGNTAAFAQGYANCLLRFVMDPVPPAACPASAP